MSDEQRLVDMGDIAVLRTMFIYGDMPIAKLNSMHQLEHITSAKSKGLIVSFRIAQDWYHITDAGYRHMITYLLLQVEQLQERIGNR